MRKLASVQTISDLMPIENADKVELAKVLGWHVVVKKGDFKVGDRCVYFEIDSILPDDNPEFDFLKNSKGKIKALKTKKIRGVISQGLVMPCNVLPEDIELVDGLDVTDILHVTKYDPPEVLFHGKSIPNVTKLADFPSFIVKSDETRIQAIPDEVAEYAGKEFVITEKMDGTSFTAYIKDGHFGICSRNMEVKNDGENIYSIVAKQYDLENKFKELRAAQIPFDFGIQGEILGPGIQSNKYKLTDYQLYLLDFWNVDLMKDIGFFFSDAEENNDFNGINLSLVSIMLGLNHVPVLNETFYMTDDIDSLVNMSISVSSLNPEHQREGIVFRAKFNKECSKYGERVSFKAINPEFLLGN